jgi:hypothetical protein
MAKKRLDNDIAIQQPFNGARAMQFLHILAVKQHIPCGKQHYTTPAHDQNLAKYFEHVDGFRNP